MRPRLQDSALHLLVKQVICASVVVPWERLQQMWRAPQGSIIDALNIIYGICLAHRQQTGHGLEPSQESRSQPSGAIAQSAKWKKKGKFDGTKNRSQRLGP